MMMLFAFLFQLFALPFLFSIFNIYSWIYFYEFPLSFTLFQSTGSYSVLFIVHILLVETQHTGAKGHRARGGARAPI